MHPSTSPPPTSNCRTKKFKASCESLVLCLCLQVIISTILAHCLTASDTSEFHNDPNLDTTSQTRNLHPAAGVGYISSRKAMPAKRGVSQQNSTDMIVHEREFISPQVRVQMECQRDKTIIKLNFTQPFNGILGAGRLDTSVCKLMGNGTKYYVLQVAHNETQCDTQWDSVNSSIFNTLFIRFHSSLETGLDVAKNIMCRLTVGDLVVGRRPTIKKPSQRKRDSRATILSSKPTPIPLKKKKD